MIGHHVHVETATARRAHVVSMIVRQVVVGRPSVVQVKIVVVRVRDAAVHRLAVRQKVVVAQVPADRVKVAAEHFAMMIVQ
jgi:hypothetical protein